MKQWVKQAATLLPQRPAGLRVINQQLWCCCGNAGIVIFDSELQQQRSLPAGDMLDMWDVTEMSNSDVVIAITTGLYHRHNGECSLYHATSTSNKIHTAYS